MIHLRQEQLRRLSLSVLVGGLLTPGCDTAPTSEDKAAGGNGHTAGMTSSSNGGGAGRSSAGSGGTVATAGSGGGAGVVGGSAGRASLGGSGGVGTQGGAGVGAAGRAPVGGRAGSAGAGSAGQSQAGAGAGAGPGGAGAGGLGGSAGSGSAHTGSWRIMPLGDSITQSTCYPQLLSAKLKAAGKTSFTFVGSITNNQSCTDGSITNAPNVTTEGHSGYILGCLTGDFTANCSGRGAPPELATWMSATPAPEVFIVHFGTNDAWNNIATNTIVGSYTKLLASIRGANPNAIVFVSLILPMHPDDCVDTTASCPNNGVKALNAALPGWASGTSTAASPVYVVDIYGAIGDPAAFKKNSPLTGDGVHPNAKGGGIMADTYLTALAAHGIPN